MKHLRHLSYVILLFINILALSSFVYASEETSSYESETSSPPNLSSIEISIDTSAESETSLAEIKATIPKTYISCIEEQTKGIKISWKKKNVTGYKIYRSTQSNRGFKRVKTISKNTITSWTDKKAKASTTYYYKIKCYIKK
jgi:fibronectin type 3 domain-containing protein